MKKILCILFICLIVINNLSAQWQKTADVPYVKTLFNEGENLYGGTWYDGVFKTTDSGNNWIEANSGISNKYESITCVITFDNKIFASVWGKGIYISTDMGNNWMQSNDGLNQIEDIQVSSIVVMANSLFAGTSSGVFCSDNGGATWIKISSNLMNVTCMLVSNSKLIAGTSQGVFVYNNSLNWNSLNNGLTNPGITDLSASDSILCVGTGEGVFISTNNGVNWTLLNNGSVYPHCTQTVLNNSENIYAGTCGTGIYYSSNNGQNWNEISGGLPSISVSSLFIYNNKIIAGTDDGIFITESGNIDWQQKSIGIAPNSHITNIALININGTSNLIASTYEHGIYLSTNQGESWTGISNGLPQSLYSTNCFAFDAGKLYTAINGRVSLSSDSGKSWTYVNDFSNPVNALYVNQNVILVGVTDGLNISSDGGENWAGVLEMAWHQVMGFAVTDTYIFAGVWGQGIFRSSDEGLTWEETNTGLSNLYIRSIFSDGNTLLAATDEGVFISDNNGLSWTLINESMKGTNGLWLGTYDIVKKNTYIFNATTSDGVYVTGDNGVKWTAVNEGLPVNFGHAPGIYSLAFLGDELFVAADDGNVYKRYISEMVTLVTDLANENPYDFSLSQNYPNPFNPTTTIEYSIPERTNVTLKIFDVLGREITTLVNEEKAAGNYKVEFSVGSSGNASSLPNGIYFYRLETIKYIETKKIVLLK